MVSSIHLQASPHIQGSRQASSVRPQGLQRIEIAGPTVRTVIGVSSKPTAASRLLAWHSGLLDPVGRLGFTGVWVALQRAFGGYFVRRRLFVAALGLSSRAPANMCPP